MNTLLALLFSVLGGIMLATAWPGFGSLTPLLFVGFVPLLIVQHRLAEAGRGTMVMLCAFICFFTWNIITTYWLLCVEGNFVTLLLSGFLPSIINSLVMLFPFWLFHITRCRLGDPAGLVAFPVFWLFMEYFHLRWDLTWPWLELGNAFASSASWIQWYEYTGVHGGSLWVLVVNVLVFILFLRSDGKRTIPAPLKVTLVALLILPVLLSWLILSNTEEKGTAAEVVVVQPNIDPYSEKFYTGFDVQLTRMLAQAEEKRTASTDLLVFPETALQEPTAYYLDLNNQLKLTGLWENQMDSSESVRMLRRYLSFAGDVEIITGVASDSLYPRGKSTVTSRNLGFDDLVYDSFNTAMLVTADTLEIYHKSKLVPAVERLPFVAVLRPLLGNVALDFGGTSGGLGMQEERGVFRSRTSSIVAAPVICYESIYGEYVGEYVRKGANLITIITNDGWWGNTAGHRHHMAYATLRAIEHRRDIARSANTGISGFINQKGEITQASAYWVPAALRGTVRLNSQVTFYTLHGDYIGRAAMWLSIFLMLWLVVKKLQKPLRRSV